MRLAGRTVVVVGAAGEIGRAVAELVLAEGARVWAVDRSAEPLRTWQTAHPTSALAVETCDAANPTSMQSLVESIDRDGGVVDGLVNAAGAWEVVDFATSDPKHWDVTLQNNLYPVLATCRTFVPLMSDRGYGSVVNFASTAGEYGSIRPAAVYAAAKGAVIAFSKSLAREVSPLGVRVNVVSPGPVGSPMLGAKTDADRHEAESRTLLGRLGTPSDIAAGVLYLLSDESSWVTGEVLRVNGGSLI